MNADRFEVAADPARLDVGDLARAQLDRVGGAGRRHQRLVEADRGVDLVGETGVADDVVLGQRLFDQQQAELVETGEVGAVGAAIGGVGVDLERRVGADQFAHGGHLLDVGSRLDLQLDAHVAVVDVALYRGEQIVGRVVDAHADPARDAGSFGAQESANDWSVARSCASSTAISSAALAIGCPCSFASAGATSAASIGPAAISRGSR